MAELFDCSTDNISCLLYISGLGSIVDVGDFTLQQVDGELTFVAPLEHSGMWKYFDNKTTPGYITVSATRCV